MTHLCTTKHPQPEARRQHVHGPLVPADLPPVTLGWFVSRTLISAAICVVFGLLIVGLS